MASKSIVICEKPNQAADIRKAVGGAYGQVLPARGHLLDLKAPEEVNPDWKAWSCDILAPVGFYPLKPNPGKDARDGRALRQMLDAIGKALKGADRVVIATDADREGQLIAEEILEYFGYGGEVFRALFTAQDEVSLKKSFAAMKPNSAYRGLGQAGKARREADQIANLSLTRGATVCLRAPGQKGVIGIGRVKTPTLAIVCRRELEIKNFKPVTYFEVAATATPSGDAGRAFVLRHAPRPEARITDRGEAEAVRAKAEGHTGPLGVTRAKKQKAPPPLPDLPTLQKRASAWGWTAAKALEVAQALYDEHKLITYPRAEVRHVPEEFAKDVPAILAGLKRLDAFAGLVPASPQVRRGKAGHFCDKCVEGEGHHAIIPNVNTAASWPAKAAALGRDERRLFDFIARHFIAALSPDHVYEATTVTLDVAGHLFRAAGAVTLAAGWTAVMGRDDGDKDEAALPNLENGEAARLDGAKIEEKTTEPPSRYTEGSLIEAMKEAWRFIDDAEKRERLKEAKGIGTPATRDQIIAGLKRQGQIEARGKTLHPTEAGLAIYSLLARVSPRMVDPGLTAEMEMRLDDVARETVTAAAMVAETVAETRRCMAALEAARGKVTVAMGSASPRQGARAGGTKGGGKRGGAAKSGGPAGGWSGPDRAPTAPMINAAETIARVKGLPLPDGYKTSGAACRAFLDQHADGRKTDRARGTGRRAG